MRVVQASSMEPPPRNGEQSLSSSSGISEQMDFTARLFPPGYLRGERGYPFCSSIVLMCFSQSFHSSGCVSTSESDGKTIPLHYRSWNGIPCFQCGFTCLLLSLVRPWPDPSLAQYSCRFPHSLHSVHWKLHPETRDVNKRWQHSL